jgi:polyphosphate kinase
MIFNNGGKKKYYLTSADIMERNLDKRIEVAVPILAKNIQDGIQFIFDTQWKDNQKARIIDRKQRNEFRKTDESKINNAQEEMYAYYLSKLQ